MKLTCENGAPVPEATEESIRNVWLDERKRGAFATLSESEQVYLQAAGDGDGPYVLEHRDGDATKHFQCVREVSRSEVQTAFLKYLRRDASWKTDFEWTGLEEMPEASPGGKPWWRFW